eukprot:CAMPEP_0198735376 /NCGR_PEP_ID=MMETSP1475-20131203/59055_1 /TAXON_ID= ORGANISM="Unidentified sp., Strain CCMP1999" /NCGR_SAMPLE_ID=MMETSP1475 /ASSEMBLY_ACC=CAM_ASM_001111 /LENGTH=165 /DNA_ID=CAMNT_0044499031 /DNA_START=81 /DNA_END=575 /DNA_ORIENTATION=-
MASRDVLGDLRCEWEQYHTEDVLLVVTCVAVLLQSILAGSMLHVVLCEIRSTMSSGPLVAKQFINETIARSSSIQALLTILSASLSAVQAYNFRRRPQAALWLAGAIFCGLAIVLNVSVLRPALADLVANSAQRADGRMALALRSVTRAQILRCITFCISHSLVV